MSIEAMKQKIEYATKAMEAACIRIDELKAENASLRQAIADAEKQKENAVGFCEVLTMDDVADIVVNAQKRTPPYEINYMIVMQLTEKKVLEKFK
jgi:FtsZ-binding cell division protein ZapB